MFFSSTNCPKVEFLNSTILSDIFLNSLYNSPISSSEYTCDSKEKLPCLKLFIALCKVDKGSKSLFKYLFDTIKLKTTVNKHIKSNKLNDKRISSCA
ncbi:hypothetical protein D3C73_1396640 [compost metagenome]